MDRLAEAKGHDRVHGHAAEGKVQVRAHGSLALPVKRRAESLRPVDTEAFRAFDCGLREGAVEYILPVLAFGIREKAEARPVLAKALVQTRLLVPAVLVVVDVVIGFGVSEMELHTGTYVSTM
jgi:hypothetical protein